MVQAAGRELGLEVRVEHIPDPRVEAEEHYYNARALQADRAGLKAASAFRFLARLADEYCPPLSRSHRRHQNDAAGELAKREQCTPSGRVRRGRSAWASTGGGRPKRGTCQIRPHSGACHCDWPWACSPPTQKIVNPSSSPQKRGSLVGPGANGFPLSRIDVLQRRGLLISLRAECTACLTSPMNGECPVRVDRCGADIHRRATGSGFCRSWRAREETPWRPIPAAATIFPRSV